MAAEAKGSAEKRHLASQTAKLLIPQLAGPAVPVSETCPLQGWLAQRMVAPYVLLVQQEENLEVI